MDLNWEFIGNTFKRERERGGEMGQNYLGPILAEWFDKIE